MRCAAKLPPIGKDDTARTCIDRTSSIVYPHPINLTARGMIAAARHYGKEGTDPSKLQNSFLCRLLAMSHENHKFPGNYRADFGNWAFKTMAKFM